MRERWELGYLVIGGCSVCYRENNGILNVSNKYGSEKNNMNFRIIRVFFSIRDVRFGDLRF